jgi:recombination protein RecT
MEEKTIFEGAANNTAAKPQPATTPAGSQPPAPKAGLNANALRDIQNQTTNAVLEHVQSLQEAGDLKLPENYAVGNQIKLAWLKIMEVTDRNGKPALEVCTKESIANALLEMVVQGLSVTKKQGDFIVYGNKLTFSLEYHGTIALARRLGGIVGVPTGNVIYENDEFEYEIDPDTGRKKILKHKQDFRNIDNNKILGAYATLQLADGGTHVEIMPMTQIRQAWMQGATKGQSPAHKNFPDQMAIKTVIGRACKLFITTSDDSGLYTSKTDEDAEETIPEQKPQLNGSEEKSKRQKLDIEDVDSTPVVEGEQIKQAVPAEPVTPKQKPNF